LTASCASQHDLEPGPRAVALAIELDELVAHALHALRVEDGAAHDLEQVGVALLLLEVVAQEEQQLGRLLLLPALGHFPGCVQEGARRTEG